MPEIPKKMISSDVIRGHIDTMILRLLQEKDCYGYQIFKLIIERSNGQYELKEPSMYASLRRMEQQGAIESYWGNEESQGGRRRYYKILPPGEQLYRNNREEWEFAKKIIEMLI
ncbi:MAG: PadR family transcriptional regulator [Planctomycetaceae bacterium]|jgi:DNA-binding PadR family transcriptional regulator|nr:PadR family transcriptional regulator [Planctomycetaceae bacterium]